MNLRKISLMILILVAAFAAGFGQEIKQKPVDAVKYFDEHKRWYNNFTEHWFYFGEISEAEVRDSIIHWEEIGKDVTDSANVWAGTYGDQGETHGDYFRWSEKGGFVWLKVNKCQGGPMQIVRGKVKADSLGIQLVTEQTLGTSGSHGNHGSKSENTEFLFVKWNGVPFLIPKNSIESFADYTAGLGEFNGIAWLYLGNPFMSKLGSEVSGETFELPIFPKGYEKFVKDPIRVQITSIGKSVRRGSEDDTSDDLIIPIRLSADKSANLEPGLELFYVNQEQHPTDRIVIKAVKTNYSIAEVIRSVPKKNCVVTEYTDCENPEYIKLKVGLKLSSNGY